MAKAMDLIESGATKLALPDGTSLTLEARSWYRVDWRGGVGKYMMLDSAIGWAEFYANESRFAQGGRQLESENWRRVR